MPFTDQGKLGATSYTTGNDPGMLFTVGLLFASEAAFLRNTGTSPSSSPPLPFPLSNLFVIPRIYLSTAKDDSVGSRLSTYGASVLSCSFLLTEVSSNTFGIAKEDDGGVKPVHERARKSDWPTLVFGCGVSKSLSRLRIDGAWGLTKHLRMRTLHTPYTPFLLRDADTLIPSLTEFSEVRCRPTQSSQGAN
jgi:hypothetical protein